MKRKYFALAALLIALVLCLNSCALIRLSDTIGNIFGSFETSDGNGNGNGNGNGGGNTEASAEEIVKAMLERFSFYDVELTDEDMAYAAVDAYIAKTGDRYAKYYNEEEYAALQRENEGENQGIGITVTENADKKAIEIISVLPDTPAEKAGLLAGDLIVKVGKGDEAIDVASVGYEPALKKLQGTKGTLCEFGIMREGSDKIIEFSILREEFTSESVIYTVSAADKTVGIVKLVQFDLTTPVQFYTAMETLIAGGCDKFIYDVRSNPGGDLASITAVLSYFLNEDDIVIRTKGRYGNMETQYCNPVSYNGSYSSCNIKRENIGKYRNYKAAVLVNGGTASAAELFTGNMKDYGLAKVFGTKTYGKGCMQSIYALNKGAIKMTTDFYYPPISDNYDGIGLYPDEGCTVELSEEAQKINVYKLLRAEYQAKDNQLAAAIEYLTK